jgi:hypothetical protein
LGVSSLMTIDASVASIFPTMDLSSRKFLKLELAQRLFAISFDGLYEVKAGIVPALTGKCIRICFMTLSDAITTR